LQPFDPSSFVEFRKRLGINAVNAINDRIIEMKTRFESNENPPAAGSQPEQEGDTPSDGPARRISPSRQT